MKKLLCMLGIIFSASAMQYQEHPVCLTCCARNLDYEGVSFLLDEKKVNVHGNNTHKISPLVAVIKSFGLGKTQQEKAELKKKIVKKLLEMGADPNYIHACSDKKDRIAPLFAAISSSNAEIVALLLHAGADVEALDVTNRTPLMCATKDAVVALNGDIVFNQFPLSVNLLLIHGVDHLCANNEGEIAYDFAQGHIKRMLENPDQYFQDHPEEHKQALECYEQGRVHWLEIEREKIVKKNLERFHKRVAEYGIFNAMHGIKIRRLHSRRGPQT